MDISSAPLNLVPTGQADELVAVPDCPGLYANRDGQVFVSRFGKIVEKKPYQMINHRLDNSNKNHKKTLYIHRVVARTFLGAPPPGKNIVRHLDGDPTNNAVSNLAWGDDEENYQDAVKHGVSLPRKS